MLAIVSSPEQIPALGPRVAVRAHADGTTHTPCTRPPDPYSRRSRARPGARDTRCGPAAARASGAAAAAAPAASAAKERASPALLDDGRPTPRRGARRRERRGTRTGKKGRAGRVAAAPAMRSSTSKKIMCPRKELCHAQIAARLQRPNSRCMSAASGRRLAPARGARCRGISLLKVSSGA